ncbi:MAG TPA: VOC family protein [Acidocella sp.]|nr:VOC family protein [Acidocella sp.]
MEPRISIITLGVRDLARSCHFYQHGLGFPTSRRPEDGIIFFKTGGTCLALYPYDELARDVGPAFCTPRAKFPGITLAHNVRTKNEVAEILAKAAAAGGAIEKPAQNTSWGGHSGYFSDPDGYLWEVAYGAFDFDAQGQLIIT